LEKKMNGPAGFSSQTLRLFGEKRSGVPQDLKSIRARRGESRIRDRFSNEASRREIGFVSL
jgi:hypothetical protein